MENKYWLSEPAGDWELTLPLGNGRLGASVWGNIDNDRVTMNEESMWFGADHKRKNPQAAGNVKRIRKLLEEGKVEEAQFLCQMSMTGVPKYIIPYQMACDMNFLFVYPVEDRKGRGKNAMKHESIQGYRRELDLENAIATVSFTNGEGSYRREYFISAKYQVLAMRFTSGGRPMKFQCNINRRPFEQYAGGNGTDQVWLSGSLGDGVSYYSSAVLGEHNGKSCQMGDYLAVWDATEAVIYFDHETNFTGQDPKTVCEERLSKAKEAGYERIRESHVKEYRKLFDKMGLKIADTDYNNVPMNELMKRTGEENVRKYILEKVFAFGRYLLIGSSYHCELPANLQGIWCGSYTPVWESKYTININLEMNYWMVDSCGLGECFAPFIKQLRRMEEKGESTAREIYGCRGSVGHHNTDCYGNTDIEGLPASAYMWPFGEAWLSLQLYEHYLYTQDKAYLSETAMPILKQNVLFFYDYMEKKEDGRWLTGPSVSPENTYRTKDGQTASITMFPAMDQQILWQLCSYYVEGCELTGETEGNEVYGYAKEILKHLPPIALTKDGRIREWLEEYEEMERGHRHISHLFGLYPGDRIHTGEEALCKAAKKTLAARLANGGGHTGWSRAWLVCMFARLWEKETVGENLQLFLEKSLKDNLYDSHPPFQIDGNFGICAGIVEALAQTRGQDIYLLTALPPEWKQGKVWGMGLKGGITLNLKWREGSVEAEFNSVKDQKIMVHLGEVSRQVSLKTGVVSKIGF